MLVITESSALAIIQILLLSLLPSTIPSLRVFKVGSFLTIHGNLSDKQYSPQNHDSYLLVPAEEMSSKQ